MKRRDFITGQFGSNKKSGDVLLSSKIEKYTTPLDLKHAAHLLRRITFAPTPELLNQIVGKTTDAAIGIILGTDPIANLPDGSDKMNWLDTAEEDPLKVGSLDIKSEIEGKLHTRYNELVSWWLGLMRDDGFPSAEKLTYFLSGIWCTDFTYDTESLIPPPLLYRNNQRLRRLRYDKYNNIAFEMTLDGAMLLFQSLNYSTKAAPNENFMRELMELFTMGIGNYSEGDIRNGARVLTGWRTGCYLYEPHPNGYFETYFSPDDHDTTAKTIMLNDIPKRDDAENSEDQVKEFEVKKLINILFTERGDAIAKFICEKVFRFFVYSDPGSVDYDFVNELAVIFKNSGFDLWTLYKNLFTCNYFYDDKFIGAQIKTPPELLIGMQRILGVKYMVGTNDKTRAAMSDLEQSLYDPPNVSGWTGYRTWISTKTYPARVNDSLEILQIATNEELTAFLNKFPNPGDFTSSFNFLMALVLPVTPDSTRLNGYKQTLLNGSAESEWSAMLGDGRAASGLRKLLSEMVYSPDFNLC